MSESELRGCVIDLVDAARAQVPAGITPEEAVRRFGLRIRLGDLPDGKDGVYIKDSKTIVISQVVTSKERRNFTCYHEFVHHLVRQEDELYSYLHETYSGPGKFEGVIELLCNIGAAELIIPRRKVRALIEAEGFTLAHLPRLCSDRDVSAPAALIQLVQCAPHRCYGVVCEEGVPPTSIPTGQQALMPKPSKPSLYILYAAWSPSAKYSIARYTILPGDHLLAQSYRDRCLISGEERIPFRSGNEWRVPCETMYFRGKGYGVFNAIPPPNPDQPRLL
ncbi:MAG: ImmA/IrrE family metallo-endopeptidase [Anaerolineales bacterium]|nr:ImmA/IrrE family metallo-endopeptidase [Anaerolineales bacterium]